MKCPACGNDTGPTKRNEKVVCECGWESGPGGVKRCTEDGPRDLVTFMSTGFAFRYRWARSHGMYRDGGTADQDDG